jgi:signal transduction histidine kinase
MAVFFFVLIRKFRINLEQRRREAITNLLLGQENERLRMARDLHDEIGPQLSTIYASMGFLDVNDEKSKAMVDELKSTMKAAIQNVRSVSHDLMSQSLKKYGLIEGINEIIQRKKNSPFEIKLESNSDGMEYNDTIKSNLYKITQELIYNSEKHSQATLVQVKIELKPESKELLYEYSDNGVGNPNYDEKEAGIGIKNIHTRVDLMNGKIHFDMKNGFVCKIFLNY